MCTDLTIKNSKRRWWPWRSVHHAYTKVMLIR